MTTERTHRCNLCRDRIGHVDGDKGGFGVHFTSGGDHEFKRLNECESHICLQCARNIHDNLRKSMPAG